MPGKRPGLAALASRNEVLRPVNILPGEEVENARFLPLDEIVLNPTQARQHFDEAALDDLTASIDLHGVLQPIGVRKLAVGYEIVFGERRYRAAVRAGLVKIPAIVYTDLDTDEAAVLTALENLQREDLDLEDEARQFARLLELTGLSQRDLAKQLGISHNYIAERVRLAGRPDLLAAYRAGTLTLRQAQAIVRGETVIPDYSAGADPGTAVPVIPDYSPEAPRERITRPELDPLRSSQLIAAFKPVDRFQRYVRTLQRAAVPADERPRLRQRLEEVITDAQVALRALADDEPTPP